MLGWLRYRTSPFMFCAAAARKNCSRTNFNLRKRKRGSPNLIFLFGEQHFHFLSLSLRASKVRRVG